MYYKYLVIFLVPVTVCFVIINWWGLKVSNKVSCTRAQPTNGRGMVA